MGSYVLVVMVLKHEYEPAPHFFMWSNTLFLHYPVFSQPEYWPLEVESYKCFSHWSHAWMKVMVYTAALPIPCASSNALNPLTTLKMTWPLNPSSSSCLSFFPYKIKFLFIFYHSLQKWSCQGNRPWTSCWAKSLLAYVSPVYTFNCVYFPFIEIVCRGFFH